LVLLAAKGDMKAVKPLIEIKEEPKKEEVAVPAI